MKSVVLFVPSDYELPECIQHLHPRILCSLFDTFASLVKNTVEHSQTHGTDSYEEKMKQKEQQLHELILENERLQVNFNETKKRMHFEFEEQLIHSKKRFTEENKYQIDLLKEHLQNTQKMYESQIQSYTKEKTYHQEHFMTRMDEILSFFNTIKTNTVSKGQFGEQFLRTFLHQCFPSAEIIDTSHVPHAGDVVLKINDTKTHDIVTIMIEMKTKNCVSKEDVTKFERDIDLHHHEYDACVFVTTSSGIPHKGEFLFQFNGSVPVIYISKFMESPLLLHLGVTMIIDLVPIFKEYRKNNTEKVEIENLFNTLSSIVAITTSMCDHTRSTCKTLNTIAQTVLEQKKKSEEKIQWCIKEIQHLTENYKNKLRTKYSNGNAIELFNTLYTLKKPKEKYIYKHLVQTAIDQKITGQYKTKEQIYKILPKFKFDEMCTKKDEEQSL